MLRKIFILAILSQFIYGCWHPFATREAENPSETNALWEQPENPAIVISNLQRAYQNRHLAFYTENFTQDFEFIADPHEKNGLNGNLYEDWDMSIEENVTSRIFELYAEEIISLNFGKLPNVPDPIAPSDSVILYRNYTLSITNSKLIPPDTPATGIAIFELIENSSGYWAIKRWSDQRQNSTDWGEFKGNFR